MPAARIPCWWTCSNGTAAIQVPLPCRFYPGERRGLSKKAFFKRRMVKFGTNNSENTVSSEVKNADFEKATATISLSLSCTPSSRPTNWWSGPGARLLVKVGGDSSGRRAEMYQEKARTVPRCQMGFIGPRPRRQYANSTISRRSVYTVKNLERPADQ